MSASALAKLNPAVYTSLQRIAAGQQVSPCPSKSFLLFQRRSLYTNSSSSHLFPRSSSLLSENPGFCFRRPNQTMAASGSMSVFGDVYIDDLSSSCGNGLDFTRPKGVYFTDRTQVSCLKASMSLRKREFSSSRLVCDSFVVDAIGRKSGSVVQYKTKLKSLHTSSSVCFSVGPARDVSSDCSSNNEQPSSSATLSLKSLKLLSGSCYLPHPEKEETGGEDAHFICDEEQAIGVADGVGGWAEVGVNAGLFARELMSNSVAAIQDEPKGLINPLTVLEKAHAGTKAKGSSTACIITVTNEELRAINLGDSGFIVVRDGKTIFESPVQQHGFNFTYQLESGYNGDLPSSGQVFTIPVDVGDVIVAGTDGLFDNLYNNDISAVVVDSVRDGISPEAMARKIAALARHRAVDRNWQSPFSAAAKEAGFRYYGGKLDDITVVVSYVTA